MCNVPLSFQVPAKSMTSLEMFSKFFLKVICFQGKPYKTPETFTTRKNTGDHRIQEITDPKNLRIWTLFTPWYQRFGS